MKPRKDRIFKGMEIIGDSLWGPNGKAKRIESPTMIRWLRQLFTLVNEELVGLPEKGEDTTIEDAVKVFGGNNDQEA
jgi:hypothetical protein